MTNNKIQQLKTTDIEKVEIRYQYIPNYCKNKTVLTIGCVDMIDVYPLQERIKSGKHQFYNLSKTCKKVVGIDINSNGITQLSKIGLEAYEYDIFSDDKLEIQNINFDVVLLSHVLEHIPNYYEFLENVIRKFNFKEIIICLPNAYNKEVNLSKINVNNTEVISNDYYFTFTTYGLINIMDSLGFKINNFYQDIFNLSKVDFIEQGDLIYIGEKMR